MVIKLQLANSEKAYLSKWVSLPCVPAILKQTLDEIDARTSQEYEMLNIKSEIKGLCACVNKTTSLGELNEAAFLVQQLLTNRYESIEAFISDRTPTMTDLLLYLQSLYST